MPKSHKIRISEINPRNCDSSSIIGKRAFLGLSVDAMLSGEFSWFPFFLEWADGRFAEVVVLMGDFLHRHNFVSDDDSRVLGRDAPADIAMEICKPISDRIRYQLALFSSPKFSFKSTFEVFQKSEFKAVHETVKGHFSSHDDFRRLVNADIDAFVKRKSKRGQLASIVRSNCLNYILEELATFSCMTDDGYSVHLYMGAHSTTLKTIVNREIATITDALANQICVDLYLSKTH
jgi:tRNA-dependent cyclodipeptide synthase